MHIQSFRLANLTAFIFTIFSDVLPELISNYATGSYFKIYSMIIQDINVFIANLNSLLNIEVFTKLGCIPSDFDMGAQVACR